MGGMESFLVEVWHTSQWVKSLATLVIFLSISQIVFGSMKFYLRKIESLQEAKTSDRIIFKSERPIAILIVLFGLKIALGYLEYDLVVVQKIISSLITIVSIYLVVVAIDIIIARWVHRFNKRAGRGYEDEILGLLKNILEVFMFAIALILILSIWGVSIGPFLASLGIIGIVIGFAMQKTLADVMGGISLVFDRCFRINDLIELESGDIGRVIDIGLRSTKIINLDNELLIVPNSQMAAIKITNYAKPNNILRIRVPIDVIYGSDPKKVISVLLRVIKANKNVLPEPEPEVRFEELAEYALRFEMIFYIEDYKKRFAARTEVLNKAYAAFNKEGIKFAFPTRTIYLADEKQEQKRAARKRAVAGKGK